jgi:UDP-3-O-[3-hydroxymyristoyl] glucosamine N-acyltransferase
MSRLTRLLDEPPMQGGIHPSAVVDPTARLGTGVGLGPLSVIGAGGGRGRRHADRAAGHGRGGRRLGEGCLVYAGVRIGRRVTIGARAILQPNCVIGGDGFSFVTESPSNAEVARETLGTTDVVAAADPTWHRIHSLGGVEIGDDVEVGACSTIDAGTIRPTRIGDGTKIDNAVLIGHNVVVGRHCLLCGQVGIAGSTVVGDRVVLAGGVGLADNLRIGDDAVITAGSGVLSNVPSGRVMMGYPATRMDAQIESYKALRRLPRLLRSLGLQKAGSDD